MNELNENDDNINEELIKEYTEPVILDNVVLEKYFKFEDIQLANKNKKKLKITDKGLYSISKHFDAEWITNTILHFFKNKNLENIHKMEIIDGTAGIGGNTINFAKHFSKVYAIEINKVHYEVLKNNLEALMINNVKIFLDNFLNIDTIPNLKHKSNVFFLDPPWGGKSYKNYTFFNLKVGKLPIYSIINILHDKSFKYVILKAPYNLNISPIFANIRYENMSIHSNSRKNMILIFFY